jgi:hypothetical protein
MRIYRYLLLFAPVAGLVLLTGALRNPFSASTEAPRLPDELARHLDALPDANAAAAVARALADLADSTRPWLQTEVKIRSRIPELLFRGQGSYLRAPGQRFRLEVRTRMDDPEMARAEATFLAVSDGHDLWQATRTSKQDLCDVQRIQLGEIYRAADGLPRLAAVRERLLAGPGIRGPEQMLRSINQHTSWVHLQVKGDAREVVGVWRQNVKASILANSHQWPIALPRLYRLTLSGPQNWPTRLEWWGPAAPDGPDRLLAEVDYASPVRDQSLSDEECSRLFTFAPGTAQVTDRTAEVRLQVDPQP